MYAGNQANGMGVGGGGGEITDGTGTINPAALNSAGLSNSSPPRGLKRSRSPDAYSETRGAIGDDGDPKPHRKRGRPMKPRSAGGVPESPGQSSMPLPSQSVPQTPQSQNAAIPPTQSNIATPIHVSTPKPTPAKPVVKALPTVRDHTTDQLGPDGDEYIPREYDEAGEKKVEPTGHLTGSRDYKCRTFFVPNRGGKLFMLATECARVLGYRDSYLLFNKNRSLFKIIASGAEKEDLIHQEILPFSYRSRQIAIVTAKSMFRQFGSRVIVNGRRVRDDYWETKARKQGFTEEDLAGEKRPGAAKARLAEAAEASANAATILGHQGDIVYSNSPQFAPGAGQHHMGTTIPLPPPTLPMITLGPEREMYNTIPRPRQEITGPPYQDRSQTSPPTELLTHAHAAAEYNKQITQQRNNRGGIINEIWRLPHEAPSSENLPQPAAPSGDRLPPATQASHSPHTTTSTISQPLMQHQGTQHIMPPQSYSQSGHQPSPLNQAPMRNTAQSAIRPEQQMHSRSPGMPLASSNLPQGYGFAPPPQNNQMWPPAQPQQSPQHGFPQYGSHPPQQSSHPQQSPHQPPSQLRHSTSNPQMQPSTVQYPAMQAMGQGYPAPGRNLYQPGQSSQHFPQVTSSAQQPGVQGWAPPQPSTGQQWSGGWNNQG